MTTRICRATIWDNCASNLTNWSVWAAQCKCKHWNNIWCCLTVKCPVVSQFGIDYVLKNLIGLRESLEPPFETLVHQTWQTEVCGQPSASANIETTADVAWLSNINGTQLEGLIHSSTYSVSRPPKRENKVSIKDNDILSENSKTSKGSPRMTLISGNQNYCVK